MDIMEVRTKFPQYDNLSDGDLLMKIHRKYYPTMHPRTFLDSVGGTANVHTTIKDEWDYWKENVSKPMTGEDVDAKTRRLGGTMGAQYTTPGRVEAGVRSGMQGVTFGGADEAIAGAMSLLPGRDYQTELARERARLESGREQFPGQSLGAEIAGSLVVPGVGLTGTGTKAGNMARGFGIGAAEGGTQGFLSGEGGLGERAKSALTGAAVGGTVGAVLRPIVDAMRAGADVGAIQRAVRRASKETGMSPQELQAAAQKAFAAADAEQGVPQVAVAQRMGGLTDPSTRASALRPNVTPKASGVVDEAMELATNPKFAQGGVPYRDLQATRQLSQGLPKTASDLELSAMGEVREAIDDVVESGFEAGPAIKQANDMWRRLSRHRDIQEAMRLAELSPTGYENGLRTEFRKILRNPKALRGYTRTEQEIMKSIVDGTPMGNIMRKLARWGTGSSGGHHNVLGASVGAGLGGSAGFALGGIPGAIAGAAAAPVLGAAGEYGAARSTQRGVDTLLDAISAGGMPGDVPQSGPLMRLLTDNLAKGSRVPGASGLLEMLR